MARADDELVLSVPPASAAGPLVWPIPGFRSYSRSSFGGDRPSTSAHPDRYHAGVDIHAPRGTVVVAMGPGVVVALQGWQSPTTKQRKTMAPELVAWRTSRALLLELDDGPVVVYGALIADSWQEFGIGKGSRVSAGAPLARVGTYPKGDTMLHIEARRPGARSAKPWYIAEGVPGTLLNVTPLLDQAKNSPPAQTPSPSSPSSPPAGVTPAQWVQHALRLLVDPELVVDGQIGAATKAAIRKFQARAGLEVDGIAGPKTRAALEQAVLTATAGQLGTRIRDAWASAWKDVFG